MPYRGDLRRASPTVIQSSSVNFNVTYSTTVPVKKFESLLHLIDHYRPWDWNRRKLFILIRKSCRITPCFKGTDLLQFHVNVFVYRFDRNLTARRRLSGSRFGLVTVSHQPVSWWPTKISLPRSSQQTTCSGLTKTSGRRWCYHCLERLWFHYQLRGR